MCIDFCTQIQLNFNDKSLNFITNVSFYKCTHTHVKVTKLHIYFLDCVFESHFGHIFGQKGKLRPFNILLDFF